MLCGDFVGEGLDSAVEGFGGYYQGYAENYGAPLHCRDAEDESGGDGGNGGDEMYAGIVLVAEECFEALPSVFESFGAFTPRELRLIFHLNKLVLTAQAQRVTRCAT